MNRAGLIVGAIVIIAGIAGAAYFISHEYRAPVLPPQTQSGTGNASVGATGASAIITYSDTGFSPSPLSIAAGTTVTWVNQSSHPMWVEATGSAGSDCSKSSLNECQSVTSGGSYSFTFTKYGTVTFFNHERSNDTGTIIVTDSTSAGPINPKALPE